MESADFDIVEATASYERFLREETRVIEQDLRAKHQAMAEGRFPFLRATFYRWAALFSKLCPELLRAPKVLGVGDIHVENFGTWRDAEARLIWGVNDFDEACPLPYTNDLVRLAASARLAILEEHLSGNPDEASDAILEGYAAQITRGGQPFVLAEHNGWLRRLADGKRRDPVVFWEKLDQAKPVKGPLQKQLLQDLRNDLPEPGLSGRIVHRKAGLGSLGRERYTFVCDWKRGRIAREAKPLIPSSWTWAQSNKQDHRIWYEKIMSTGIHVPDPFLRVKGRWVLRRLAPDCCRVELADLLRGSDELRLLHAMGAETANIHLGSRTRLQVKQDLAHRGTRWLSLAAKRMEEATTRDWKQWKRHWKGAS